MDLKLDHLLGGMDAETFLRDYWQKKPLLVRNALPGFEAPFSPEELAGLACEEESNARLVLEHGGKRPWEMRHGPFKEQDFTSLPPDHWSLLVTDMEKLVPELADLRDRFRFIPDWRIDDLMVSYAPPGGSVGPHTDQYDVFLIQAHGHRHWMIEDELRSDEDNDLIPNIDLRILREFDPDQDWVLKPGDMLYLPPGIPHHGVAQDRCMTISVGFRAPSHGELVTSVLDYLVDEELEEQRYADPDLKTQEHPGEIAPQARHRVRDILRRALQPSDEDLDRFFGRFITDRRVDLMPLYPEPANLSPADFQQELQEQQSMERNPAARFAFIRTDEATFLYADGEEYGFTPGDTPAVAYLCDQRLYEWADVERFESERLLEVMTDLYNRGCIF